MNEPLTIVSIPAFEQLKETFSQPHDLERLVRRFFEISAADLREMKACFLRGEWKVMRRIAHRMISSAHPMGAIQMISILRTIEQDAIACKTAMIREQLKALEACLTETRLIIEKSLETNSGAFNMTKGNI